MVRPLPALPRSSVLLLWGLASLGAFKLGRAGMDLRIGLAAEWVRGQDLGLTEGVIAVNPGSIMAWPSGDKARTPVGASEARFGHAVQHKPFRPQSLPAATSPRGPPRRG